MFPELQNFMSDPHSYQSILYVAWLHNRYKWGIIVKNIEDTYDTITK